MFPLNIVIPVILKDILNVIMWPFSLLMLIPTLIWNAIPNLVSLLLEIPMFAFMAFGNVFFPFTGIGALINWIYIEYADFV